MRILLIFSVCLVLEISHFVQGRQLDSESSEILELKRRLLFAESRIKALEDSDETHEKDYKRFVVDGGIGTPIGFTACVAVHDLSTQGNQPIVFDKIITNTGGAYNNNTGKFIAPVKGLYVFHLAAMTSPDHRQYLEFVKDTVVISHVFPDSSSTSTFQTGSGDWVLELDGDSEVWVQTMSPGEIHGNCFSTFSGFLLQLME